MSKPNSPTQATEEMRPEYDFRGGVWGKHAKAMQSGYTVTIHQDDGTTTVQNHALRRLITI